MHYFLLHQPISWALPSQYNQNLTTQDLQNDFYLVPGLCLSSTWSPSSCLCQSQPISCQHNIPNDFSWEDPRKELRWSRWDSDAHLLDCHCGWEVGSPLTQLGSCSLLWARVRNFCTRWWLSTDMTTDTFVCIGQPLRRVPHNHTTFIPC